MSADAPGTALGLHVARPYRFTLTNGETIEALYMGMTVDYHGTPIVVYIEADNDSTVPWHAIVQFSALSAP